MEMLNGIVSEVPERAKKLAAAFWPGPLTMVMPRGPEQDGVSMAVYNRLIRAAAFRVVDL